MKNNVKVLKVGVTTAFGDMIPYLQHTAIGDQLLSNVFEPIVSEDEYGFTKGVAAKGLRFNEDFTVLTLKIDTSKKFPDGTTLTPALIKRSWQIGIKNQGRKASRNVSTLDLMYKILGFDSTADDPIPGVVVSENDSLDLHFQGPFPTAIYELRGLRFAPFHIDASGRVTGTGPFDYAQIRPNHVEFYPRSNFGFSKIEVSLADFSADLSETLRSKYDVILGGSSRQFDAALGPKDWIGVKVGFESMHLIFRLNRHHGEIFSDLTNRRAMSRIAMEWIDIHKHSSTIHGVIENDKQIFLKYQIGRLNESEDSQFYQSNEIELKHLEQVSKSRPLRLVNFPESFYELLKKHKITIDHKFHQPSDEDYIKMGYRGDGFDIYYGAYSVYSGDPDGMYHILGRNGAIATDNDYVDKLAEFMEKGRSETNKDERKKIYENAHRVFLSEIPHIHLGYQKQLTFYNPTKVSIPNLANTRVTTEFSMFEPAGIW